MAEFIGGYPSFLRQNNTIEKMGQYDVRPQFKDYTAEMEERLKSYKTPNYGSNQSSQGSNFQNPGTGNASLDAFMGAISGQESGGNYGIVNGDSGALGKYQIMPFNLSQWARDAGLSSTPSRSQFLGDPQMQELMARTQIQNAYNRYNDYGQVAAWWYGGEGGRSKYASGGGSNPESGGYPSIRAYVAQVLRRMNG